MYEEPEKPEIILDTCEKSIEQCVNEVVLYLNEHVNEKPDLKSVLNNFNSIILFKGRLEKPKHFIESRLRFESDRNIVQGAICEQT